MTHELRSHGSHCQGSFARSRIRPLSSCVAIGDFTKTFDALYIDWYVSRAFPRISMKAALLLPLAF